MAWFEIYNAIFRQIKNVLEGIAEIKSVSLGGAFKVANLPLAVVVPRETRVSQASIPNMLRCELAFDVMVFIRETEPEDWFNEIISLMGKVFDAFVSNRTLSNAVLDLVPLIFSPGEITALNKLYYGGLIRFQTVFYFAR